VDHDDDRQDSVVVMVARLGANVVCMRFAMEKKKPLEKVRFYLHKIDFEKTLLKTAGKIGKRSCWQAPRAPITAT